MSDLFHAAPSAEHEAARQLLAPLRAGTPISRRMINTAMVSAFGGSDVEGRWTQRESFEVLEHALALHLRSNPPRLLSLDDVRPVIMLADRLPTQTVRSEDQIDWQQFSTPIDIAAVAVLLASVQTEDVIIEPSAGNGLLVAQIGAYRSLRLNEIDPARRGRLAAVFPDAIITGHDGATVNSSLTGAERPSLIIMIRHSHGRLGAELTTKPPSVTFRRPCVDCAPAAAWAPSCRTGSGQAPGCAISIRRCCVTSPREPRSVSRNAI